MRKDEKIGYMISCLQVAKDELAHMSEDLTLTPEDYGDEQAVRKYYAYIERNGMPNKSLVTDNLRNVARMAFKLAREIDHER